MWKNLLAGEHTHIQAARWRPSLDSMDVFLTKVLDRSVRIPGNDRASSSGGFGACGEKKTSGTKKVNKRAKAQQGSKAGTDVT